MSERCGHQHLGPLATDGTGCPSCLGAEVKRLRRLLIEWRNTPFCARHHESNVARLEAEVERLREQQTPTDPTAYAEEWALTEIERLRAEVGRLKAIVAEADETIHYANGVAQLAVKHRDSAEAEVERHKRLISAVIQKIIADAPGADAESIAKLLSVDPVDVSEIIEDLLSKGHLDFKE